METLEQLINSELEWCDIQGLSINMKKTNVMMIKSVEKRTPSLSIVGYKALKYLGIMTDEFLTWKYTISFVSSRISRNYQFSI